MRSFTASVCTLGANLRRRIAAKVRSKLTTLWRRGWTKIRQLVSPLGTPISLLGTTRTRTLAEQLGYGRHARLLIVHADDLGLAPAVNAAFIDGLKTGLINSGSAMVPCPYFSEIAAFVRRHPDVDIGLHLTLTSEQGANRWVPVASPSQVPSLVDDQGYFPEKWTPETRISLNELEIELRAQIEGAYAVGLRPTHLDSHQYVLLSRRDVFELYLRLAREYRLPPLISREWFSRIPYLPQSLNRHDAVLDRVVIIQGNLTPEQWPDFYDRALGKLPPGVTEFLIHPGYDSEEFRAFFENRTAWGAAWRQRDFDFFTSDGFRARLAEENIELTTWREIANRR